jgi:hypothetical protein
MLWKFGKVFPVRRRGFSGGCGKLLEIGLIMRVCTKYVCSMKGGELRSLYSFCVTGYYGKI